MHRNILKIISVALAIATLVTVCSISSSALSESELTNSINKLEQQSKDLEAKIKSLQKDINAQQQLKEAIEQKIAVVQKQINLCNSEIYKINDAIAKNQAQIDENNKQIEADKLAFKKRLRAIYMSNSENDVQLLLGADDFTNFLQLSQLTASVSARDKLMMEKLAAAIKALKEKQEENNKLLEQQVEIKKTVAAKQAELQQESNSIQSVINKIDANQNDLEATNAAVEKQIKDYKKTLASLARPSTSGGIYDGSEFLWPTPGYYRISAGFQSNDSVHRGDHDGIDIIGSYRGQISGAKIVAIADGTVEISKSYCSHNYPKNGSCGCGGGFGNYVKINHGTKDGKTYTATYGHMASVSVSAGAKVKKGQVIGTVGSTGWSTGYHLHFGIAINGIWKNPMNYYRKVG